MTVITKEKRKYTRPLRQYLYKGALPRLVNKNNPRASTAPPHWECIPAVSPFPRLGLLNTTCAVGDDVYCMGGTDYDDSVTGPMCFKFNVTTRTWTTLARIPAIDGFPNGFAESAIAYANGKLYLFGGMEPDTGEYNPEVFCYDIANNTWDHFPSPIVPIGYEYFAIAVAPTKILVAGGWCEGSPEHESYIAHIYDVTTNTSLRIADIPEDMWEPSRCYQGFIYKKNNAVSIIPSKWGVTEYDVENGVWLYHELNTTDFKSRYTYGTTLADKVYMLIWDYEDRREYLCELDDTTKLVNVIAKMPARDWYEWEHPALVEVNGKIYLLNGDCLTGYVYSLPLSAHIKLDLARDLTAQLFAEELSDGVTLVVVDALDTETIVRQGDKVFCTASKVHLYYDPSKNCRVSVYCTK